MLDCLTFYQMTISMSCSDSENDGAPAPAYPDWFLIESPNIKEKETIQSQPPQYESTFLDQAPVPVEKASVPELSKTESDFRVEKYSIFGDGSYLTVLAIPYYKDNLLFLPVIQGKLEYKETEPTGCFGKISRKMKNKLKSWSLLNTHSIRYKMYQSYRNHFLEEHPFQKFTKRMPTNIRGFRIIHPSKVTREQILKQLYAGLHERFENRVGSTIMFGALLPLCIVMDVLTMGFVLTALDLTALMISLNSMLDASHLDSLVKMEKINYETHPALEQFDSERLKTSLGIPSDKDIHEFCNRLNFPAMAKTIRKVRDRQIILNNINTIYQ